MDSVALTIGLFLLFLGPGLVAALKGHENLFDFGLAGGGPAAWFFAAFRLAHLGSYWERWFYREEKRQRVRRRYGAGDIPGRMGITAGFFAFLIFVLLRFLGSSWIEPRAHRCETARFVWVQA